MGRIGGKEEAALSQGQLQRVGSAPPGEEDAGQGGRRGCAVESASSLCVRDRGGAERPASTQLFRPVREPGARTLVPGITWKPLVSSVFPPGSRSE